MELFTWGFGSRNSCFRDDDGSIKILPLKRHVLAWIWKNIPCPPFLKILLPPLTAPIIFTNKIFKSMRVFSRWIKGTGHYSIMLGWFDRELSLLCFYRVQWLMQPCKILVTTIWKAALVCGISRQSWTFVLHLSSAWTILREISCTKILALQVLWKWPAAPWRILQDYKSEFFL